MPSASERSSCIATVVNAATPPHCHGAHQRPEDPRLLDGACLQGSTAVGIGWLVRGLQTFTSSPSMSYHWCITDPPLRVDGARGAVGQTNFTHGTATLSDSRCHWLPVSPRPWSQIMVADCSSFASTTVGRSYCSSMLARSAEACRTVRREEGRDNRARAAVGRRFAVFAPTIPGAAGRKNA